MSNNLSSAEKLRTLLAKITEMTNNLSKPGVYSKISEGWQKAAKGPALAAAMQIEMVRGGKQAVKKAYAIRAEAAKQEAAKAARAAAEQAEAIEAASMKAAIAAAASGKGRKAKRKLERLQAMQEAREKASAAAKAAQAAAAAQSAAPAVAPEKKGLMERIKGRFSKKEPLSIRDRIKTKFDNPPGALKRGYQKLRKPLGNDPFHVMAEKNKGAFSAVTGTASSLFTLVKDQSIEAAKKYSEAFGVLRSSSGAASMDMDALVGSFKTVGGQVPQSLTEVGKAMGILNRDAGLTGKKLEGMTKTLLDASRLTGTDSAAAAESAAKAMSVWGIATDDSKMMMEKFFAASRAGDTSMGDLMKKMGKSSEPLKQMGVGFDQSMVLMAKWQSQGLTPIEDALKKGLPAGGISAVADKIRTAATETEAARIATETFGASVSGDLVTALRGGQVEFKGIMDAMNASDGGIQKHASSVESFGDRFATLQNRITLALAPLGEALMPFGEAMVSVIEFITNQADILVPAITGMAAVILGLLAPALWASAVAGWAAVAPFLPIIAVIALVGVAIAGLAYLFKYHMQGILNLVESVSTAVSSFFGKFFGEDKSVTATMNVKQGVAGQATSGSAPLQSNYHGLDYVPYDGMQARLHKGERIMTASENREYSAASGAGGGAISITGNTFNVRQDSDIDAIARALAREIKSAGGLMA
ncbi:phage tail tape measure protein [Paenibacillus tuaregi]|uniref:phage tail tape measure protein n=1 Tax=Paenibacillus tuaregi TaxID=1816681 RepID=UPI000837CFC6|nr:phage tail tape measure protein [Paenibacillus tuaregi]